MRPKPFVLVVLDGWGVAPTSADNAISQALTPHMDSFIRDYPSMTLVATGEGVGLPRGQAGSSEVGHLLLGAGFAPYQALPRINKAIADGTFFQNGAFLKALAHGRRHRGRLHLIGLVSPGGVHSHSDHLYALLDLARRENLGEVYVHAILDGRDTPPASGLEFVGQLEEKMHTLGVGAIATLSGRSYAMDRDNRWDRVEKAYRAMVKGESDHVTRNAGDAIRRSYQAGVYDEEMVPAVIGAVDSARRGIRRGDAVIFFNFRPDRARELAAALTLPTFKSFDRGPLVTQLGVVTMTTYEEALPVLTAFPRETVDWPLGRVVSEAGWKQLHIAETEKYAHVTYFFNGGVEEPWPGEEDILIPSPPVVSYAETPAMSAVAIAERTVQAILSETYDVVVINFANADMVGHTGNLTATMSAVATLDKCLGNIADAVLAKNGLLMVTADHGNAEALIHPQTGEIDKAHSANPVPLIVIANQFRGKTGGLPDVVGGDLSLRSSAGTLADVAPTILKILELPKPSAMTGKPLL